MIKANFEWLCKQNHIAPTTAAADIFILSPYSGTESIVSRDDVSVPPAPSQREIVLIISRFIQKNTRR